MTSNADRDLDVQERRSLQVFAMFAITLLLIGVLVFLTHEEKKASNPEPKEAELRIDRLFTQLAGWDNLSYDFDMRILITNLAEAPAEEVRIEIAGIDNRAKLTYDKQDSALFSIPAENTTERSVKLTLPRVNAHKMFVMVFVGDELKLKGYAIISVAGSSAKRDFQVTYQRDVEGQAPLEPISDDVNGEEQLVFLMFAIVVVIELILLVSMMSSGSLRSALGKMRSRKDRKCNGDEE